MSEPEDEAVEVQIQAGGDHNCVFVFPTRHVDENKINLNLLVKSAVDNDESTAQTETSTDVDENSLRERFSFGSLSLSDTGTFQSHDNAVHAPQPWRVRSKRDNLFSIGEANGSSNVQSHEFQKNSLFDLDLSDDDRSQNAIDTSSGNKLDSSEVDTSNDESESIDIFQDKYTLYSESRAEFYRGYSIGNFVGDKLHSCERSASSSKSSSSKSMFPTDTLNTDSRIEFYRVSSSVHEEPLSCREQYDQPALSCDEGLWDPNRSTESAQVTDEDRGNVSAFKDISGGFFSTVTCCFMPPRG